jgi:hypothetical protein
MEWVIQVTTDLISVGGDHTIGESGLASTTMISYTAGQQISTLVGSYDARPQRRVSVRFLPPFALFCRDVHGFIPV